MDRSACGRIRGEHPITKDGEIWQIKRLLPIPLPPIPMQYRLQQRP